MKRKLVSLFMTAVILSGTFVAGTWASGGKTIDINEGVSVFMNGKPIQMKDEQGNTVEGFIYNGTTYLPARAISEANGNNVTWDADGKNVYISGSANEDATRANLVSESEKGYTFELNENVTRRHVTYDNRYGIEISADLYLPKDMEEGKKYPAIVISGPFGAVKEQSSGLYAQQMASYGFAALAFDPSFCGESGGKTRNMASPEIFTEDFSAAVDFLDTQSFIDPDRIGAIGICGLSGMAVTAAGSDTRIKAVATSAMYDMSRDMSKGYQDYYTDEQRHIIMDYLSDQRQKDAVSGTVGLGLHEIAFDENNNPITEQGPIPDELPDGVDPVTKAFFDYYAKRARNPRAVNFVSSWTATTPIPFFNFPLMTNIKDISPRPVLFITGENAHSRYYSEDAYAQANEPKELIVVPDTDHVDLYDDYSKIPFDRLNSFFTDALK